MANTDFFDEDLVQQRDDVKRIKYGRGDQPSQVATEMPTMNDGGGVSRPVSDFNLTRMARHREGVDDQVAHTSEELERLKQRQVDLEREKKNLEDLRRKQEQYETGRREMIEYFNQSLITLEKDEIRTDQVRNMLEDTRRRFKGMLDEVESINEENWPDGKIGEELAKALAIIGDARIEYNKALARIEAAMGSEAHVTETRPVIFEESARGHFEEHSFLYWLKAGFAFTLPLSILIIILVALYYFMQNQGLIL
ncbi:MAG: hypothetical protein EOM20_01025 [Spartobacteria bacterium]|nr:hypothetical protein [Spartobacteria bacterium]